MRYLYAEMQQIIEATEEDFKTEDVQQHAVKVLEFKEDWFRKRDEIEIYLYVSTAPCGAASFKEAESDILFTHATCKGTANQNSKNVPPGCMILPNGVCEAIGNPGKTLSCSDKIALWCALGVQGSLISSTFIREPIYLHGVTCSRKFDEKIIYKATFGRFSPLRECQNGDKNIFAQMASISIEFKERVGERADVGESDESISWMTFDEIARVHDGRTGLAISGKGDAPRASKQEFKISYVKLAKRVVKTSRNTLNTLKKRLESMFQAELDGGFNSAINKVSTTYDDLKRACTRNKKASTITHSFAAESAWRNGNRS